MYRYFIMCCDKLNTCTILFICNLTRDGTKADDKPASVNILDAARAV